eukprot:4129531-Pleurochrysis_carterae.AAC.3
MRRFNDLSSYLVTVLIVYGVVSTLVEAYKMYTKERTAAATDCAKANAPAEAAPRRKETGAAAPAKTGRRTKSRKS